MTPHTVAREDRTRSIQALHAAISRREWSEVERAADTIRDAFDRPQATAPQNVVLRFGDGMFLIDTGSFCERPAVFLKPVVTPGPVGPGPARSEHRGPLDRMEPGEIVWTFPTMRQAEAVRDALFGLLAPAGDATKDEVLFAFHRYVTEPKPLDVSFWTRAFPQFAEDIRAHAVEVIDMEAMAAARDDKLFRQATEG